MPNPSRDEIKPQVCEVLERASALFGIPKTASQIANNENWILRTHLGLMSNIRAELSKPYSRISDNYPNGERVTRGSAQNSLTVSAAITLVYKRSQGDKS